jgi:hypothetical protein
MSSFATLRVAHPTASRRRSPKFPSNQKIASAILSSKYGRAKITGTAISIRRTYGMDQSVQEDLQSRAILHLYRTDWAKVLRSGGVYPRNSDRRDLTRLVNRLADYAVILIRNSMIDEARRALSNGLSGLTARAPKEMPWVSAPEEMVAHPIETERIAMANEAVRLAETILPVREFQAVYLAFGLDGGPERGIPQIARDMGISRPHAAETLASAMEKLKAAVGHAGHGSH